MYAIVYQTKGKGGVSNECKQIYSWL